MSGGPSRGRPHLAATLILVLGLGVWWQATLGLQAFTWETYRRVQVAREPVALPQITLEDQQGRRFRADRLEGPVYLINFIYTRCRTLCVTSGAVFARLQRQLARRYANDEVALLSISLEPARDTPQRLGDYLQRYRPDAGPAWIAARPLTPEQGRRLYRRLGVVRIEAAAGEIRHNDAIHIVDPAGRLVRIVDSGDTETVLNIVAQLRGGRARDAETGL